MAFCSLFAGLLAAGGNGLRGEVSLMDMSLDQLAMVEIKTSVASVRAKSIEEQPGIVSVITAHEIHETGARDLSDILLRVPGYSLDTDVESMIGLMFRGMQAQEGKALLIVDGIEVNEPLYGSLPILNHVPADMIEQVEIIRGPGSAAYGGSAGLSVIRVTTKGAAQNGGYAFVTPSFSEGHFSEAVAAGAGYTHGDWRYSFNAALTETDLSNQTYVSPAGNSIQLGQNSRVYPGLFDFDAGWKALDLRILYDSYRYKDAINYGETITPSNDTHFDSLLASLKYDLEAASWLKITPQFTYRRQMPWFVQGPEGNYDVNATRYQGDLTAVAEFGGESDLMVGFRWVRDQVHASDTSFYGQTAATYYGGSPDIRYTDTAEFVQYDLDTSWVNISLGGRYEYHPAVGGAFVPRVAFTRAWKKFHLKALFSEAFRIPAINVILESVGPKLQAEKTTNYEMEAGYKFDHGLSWTGNLFFMVVHKPIIFSATASGADTEGYHNGGKTSSTGLETELKWDRPLFSAYLNYSLYQARDNDEDYLRGDANRFLGAPTHKVAWSGTWHAQPNLDFNLNGYWMSERLAYTYPTGGIAAIPSEFILNTYFEYRAGPLSYGLGGVDLLNVKRYAPQPYAGGTDPAEDSRNFHQARLRILSNPRARHELKIFFLPGSRGVFFRPAFCAVRVLRLVWFEPARKFTPVFAVKIATSLLPIVRGRSDRQIVVGKAIGDYRRWLLLFGLFLAVPLYAGPAKEYEIKAAFLFNFTKFIEWPPQRFAASTDPIVIGVYGQNPFGDELATDIRGRRVNGREVQVREVSSAKEASNVHLLFISGVSRGDSEALSASLRGSGTVVVTEGTSSVRTGGAIVFVVENNRVRFQIDQEAAELAGVKLSSQLLKIATAIRKGD